MAFILSQVGRVGFAVFVILFCGELFHNVKGVPIVKVYNIGENITLDCYSVWDYYKTNTWYKNVSFLANKDGINRKFDRDRISQEYKLNPSSAESFYSISISDADIGDSAQYSCYKRYSNTIKYYDVHVIGCSCFLTDHSNTEKGKVFCELENYRAEIPFNLPIIINGNINKSIYIQTSSFSFAMLRHQLYKSLHFELQLYNNTISVLRCMLPAQFTSPYPSTRRTRFPTTPLIPTTQNGRPKASHTTSHEPISRAAISTAVHYTPQNKNSNRGKNLDDSDITMIIVISGSVFILILIVLIVVLRYKQTKNRQGNEHNGIASVDCKDIKEHPEACYESVGDKPQRGLQKTTSNEKMKDKCKNQPSTDQHGGMVDNILYDSTDKIAESSISRTEGPLDNALYAMPDKRKTLDRESKSGTIAGFSAADILYGNSVIITQQGQKDNQGGDQYENVEMPGSGGGGNAEEIPLYEMPDKAPQRNTLKATPKANQTLTLSKDEVVDVDALYAEVDKTKKK